MKHAQTVVRRPEPWSAQDLDVCSVKRCSVFVLGERSVGCRMIGMLFKPVIPLVANHGRAAKVESFC